MLPIDTAGELVGACGRAKAFWMRRVSAASLEAPMSLRPTPCADISANTAAVARAAFPKGNVYLRLRDELGTIFTDAPFALLFASRGQPAACLWRLALVTLLHSPRTCRTAGPPRRYAVASPGSICSGWS